MSMEFFTAEQKDLIPEYQAKWKKIALSTQRIDRDKAKEAMIKACKLLRQNKPEIVFCDSPFQALEILQSNSKTAPIFDWQGQQAAMQTLGDEQLELESRFKLFWATFLRQATMMFKLWLKKSKIRKKAVYKLITQLTNQTNKSW